MASATDYWVESIRMDSPRPEPSNRRFQRLDELADPRPDLGR